jgi:hypothetical protein
VNQRGVAVDAVGPFGVAGDAAPRGVIS